ncbi:hypothetical protein U9R90_00740 [Streptomyces sp. E11-3]|uniref:hypothetical protein n=1 Tax=Streptomyces sp. E11-3 TaxID=3110112 RepID=UPI00397F38B9
MTQACPGPELGGCPLEALSTDLRVYVRHGRFRGGSTLAHEIHAVVAELHTYWERYASGGFGRATIPEIEASLEPLDASAAIDLMTTLAAHDLVWPNFTHMDPEEARSAAEQVVNLLGPRATWWSNFDDHSSTAVTECSFDGLIAGTDGERFAILIQVAED